MKSLALLVVLSANAAAQATPTPPFAGVFTDSFETHALGAHCAPNFLGNGSSFCTCSPDATGGKIVAGSGHTGSQYFDAGDACANGSLVVPLRRLGFWFTGTSTPYAQFRDTTGTWFTVQLPAANWGWVGWDFSVPVEALWIASDCQQGGCWSVDDFHADPWPGTPPETYCTGKINSVGCAPMIGWLGTSSASATSGFEVRAALVRNQRVGLLFYGVTGRQSVPYQGGTLCVRPAIKRTTGVNSGGALPPVNNCTGVYSIDMNAFAAGALGGSPLPALSTPGTVVDCQWWGRDPPAPFGTMLSNALEYTIAP